MAYYPNVMNGCKYELVLGCLDFEGRFEIGCQCSSIMYQVFVLIMDIHL